MTDLGIDFGGDVRPTASYTLRVNGYERPVNDAWIGESLLYVLRERLGLAGAKDGCQQGECGACSVQVDGQLVAGCLVPAALAADSEISTVEGLAGSGGASDVQQALADFGAVQCGYCTPGLAMAVHDLLSRNHRPTDVEARQALCGNLCRCTGYRGVLAAVHAVADARGGAELDAELEASEATPAEPVEADELPLYTDSELWHEAEQPLPAEATVHQAGVYEATTPHGTPYDPSYETAGYGTFPTQSTGYDTGTYAGGYPATNYDAVPYIPAPHHGDAYDSTTPAHGIRLPEDDHA